MFNSNTTTTTHRNTKMVHGAPSTPGTGTAAPVENPTTNHRDWIATCKTGNENVHKRKTNFASPTRLKQRTAEERKATHERLLKVAAEQREGYVIAGAQGKRVGECGQVPVVKDTAALSVAGGGLRFSGMRKCGNRECPSCSEERMKQDRALVAAAIVIAEEMGLVPLMATLTASHVTAEALKLARGNMAKAVEIQSVKGIVERTNKAWRKMTSGKGAGAVKMPWRDYVRAREVTLDNLLVFGDRTGVHHHFHVLIFVNPADYLGEEHDGKPDAGVWSWSAQEERRRNAAVKNGHEFVPRQVPHLAVEAVGRKLWRGWSKTCKALKLGVDVKGFDVVQVDSTDAKNAAEYLVKGEKMAATLAASEVAAGQFKDARLARRIAPAGLLRNIARTAEGSKIHWDLVHQWQEYEDAVKGLQWVRFGAGGLRELAVEKLTEEKVETPLSDDDRVALVSYDAISSRVDELRLQVATAKVPDKFVHLTDTLESWGVAYRVVTTAEWAEMLRQGYAASGDEYLMGQARDWDDAAEDLVERLFSEPPALSYSGAGDPPF